MKAVYIADVVRQFVSPWSEPVRFLDRDNSSGTLEIRTVVRSSAPLLEQLENPAYHMFTSKSESGGGKRTPGKSAPPGPLDSASLIETMTNGVHTYRNSMCEALGTKPRRTREKLWTALPSLVPLVAQLEEDDITESLIAEVGGWHYAARVILGYEQPRKKINGVVCPKCYSTVALGASGTLHCVGCREKWALGEWATDVQP